MWTLQQQSSRSGPRGIGKAGTVGFEESGWGLPLPHSPTSILTQFGAGRELKQPLVLGAKPAAVVKQRIWQDSRSGGCF